jgi:isopentenyl-diphosphate Delta-isomerase
MNEPLVILVDENDVQTGIIGKMEAHKLGLLHRAISVFVINSSGEWLIQRRALDKYHSKGLWTNTCCSHPYPGESIMDAANRRLMEEMGLQCELNELFTFIYKEKVDSDLFEHELDHVFIGITDENPVINTKEVYDWKLINFHELHEDVKNNPENYTYWFKKIYQKIFIYLTNIK